MNNFVHLVKCDDALYTFSELAELERKGGGSYYLFDIQKLEDNVTRLRDMFGSKVSLSYSVKANPWLSSYFLSNLPYMEICSPGELKKCLDGGWDLNRVTLDGLLKTPDEIDAALLNGVARISIDSLTQWELVKERAQRQNKRVNVLLRLSSGNQFGMDREEIFHLIGEQGRDQTLYIEGIHYYAGTQRKNSEETRKVFDYLEDFLDELQRQTGRLPDLFELGGGAPVPYFLEDDRGEYENAFETLGACVRKLSERIPVIYEAGRILTASAGCYISKIIDCKSRNGSKIVIIDGGTHQLTYYGSVAGRKTPRITCVSQDADPGDEEENVTVCGSLCTAQDIMARKVKLKNARQGAYLVFGLAGAYSVTECSSDFLSRTKPAILIRKDDGDTEVLRAPEETVFFAHRGKTE